MGLNYNNIKWLLYAKNQGVISDDVATIGRQGLHIKKSKLDHLLSSKGFTVHGLNNLFTDGYSDDLLRFLGAKNVDSFDFSNYENAKVIHDFNKPIDNKYKNKYDLVIDGGTLEHIFNFPIAIKNCMEMVKTGGHFISMTTCNNFSGHGFYQFSPELFFRVFSKENGFTIKTLVLESGNKWFSVEDPDIVKQRVTFVNKKETTLMLIAKKEVDKNIFEESPLQSDYVSIWNNLDKKVVSNSNFKKIALKIIFRFKIIFQKTFFIYDNKCFKRIKI